MQLACLSGFIPLLLIAPVETKSSRLSGTCSEKRDTKVGRCTTVSAPTLFGAKLLLGFCPSSNIFAALKKTIDENNRYA